MHALLLEGLLKEDSGVKSSKDNLIKALLDTIDAFRVLELGDQPMAGNELSVPTRVQASLIYTHCFLRKPWMHKPAWGDLGEILLLLESPWMLGATLYPYIFPIHAILAEEEPPGSDNGRGVAKLPPSIPCTAQALEDHGIYLVDQGRRVTLLVRQSAALGWLSEVFDRNIESLQDVMELNEIPTLETYLNQLVNAILDELRRLRGYYNFEFQIISPLHEHYSAFLEEILVEDAHPSVHTSAAAFLKGLSGQLLDRQLARLSK